MVIGQPVGFVDFDAGDDQDLRERKCNALAQLVGVIERMYEEIPLYLKRRVLVAGAQAGGIGRIRSIVLTARRGGMRRIGESGVLRGGIRELLTDVRLDADALHVSYIARSGSEGRLFEQSSRVRSGDWSRRGGWWRRISGVTATSSARGEGNQCTERCRETWTTSPVSGPGCIRAPVAHSSPPLECIHAPQRSGIPAVDDASS